MGDCSHTRAQDYVREQIEGGTRTFSRGNSHVQTIMGAKGNCDQCKSFVKTTRLDTKLF